MSQPEARIGIVLREAEKKSYRRERGVEVALAGLGADEAGTYLRPPSRRVLVDGPLEVASDGFPAVFRDDGGRVVVALPRPAGAFRNSNRFYASDPRSRRAIRAEVARLRAGPPGSPGSPASTVVGDGARPRCACGDLAEPSERCNLCGFDATQHHGQHLEDEWAFLPYCRRCGDAVDP